LLAIAAIDRDEAGDIERRLHDGKLSQFSLVENLDARVQRLEEHRRIDIALVVRAVNRGMSWKVFTAGHSPPDPGKRQREPHATVPQPIQTVGRSQDDAHEQTNRAGDRNVQDGDDVRDQRANDKHCWH